MVITAGSPPETSDNGEVEPETVLSRRKDKASFAVLVRIVFWVTGILLACAQAWAFRFHVSADSISYLDMSDAIVPGGDWHRLVNGVWSPLYPFLLGLFRRLLSPSPIHEIAASHFLNVGFFLFALISFEFLLSTITKTSEHNRTPAPLPPWACMALAYSLFLWGAISATSLTALRPDMLMSGLVYLAVGLLLQMRFRRASWIPYLKLGLLIGVGYLAKAAFLPLGVWLLAASLLLVDSWRPAVKMVFGALAIALLIGSAYFIPLSLTRGYFTLGESGKFNYLVHVDGVSSSWYLQNIGIAKGSFVHAPVRIFSEPPAYAFPRAVPVTHPLRFDPSEWIKGVRPRFDVGTQIAVIKSNAVEFLPLLLQLAGVIGALALLTLSPWGRASLLRSAANTWPILLMGFSGCAMYVLVHVESRYVAEFLVLLGLGVLSAFWTTKQAEFVYGRALATAIAISLVAPLLWVTSVAYLESRRMTNADADAAIELNKLGLREGDRVARISPTVNDLGVERIARIEVVAEVALGHSTEFWASSVEKQRQVLETLIAQGAKAVIATQPAPANPAKSGWTRLGNTHFWAWLPN